MRGIISASAYLPHRRLDRGGIAAVAGAGGGRGTRTVASYDEDTTTLGVEAARLALAPVITRPRSLLFSTVSPAYVDKTNACAIHAALQLDSDVVAADLGGAVRSGMAALRLALLGSEPSLVVTADIRTGLPGSADETAGGDAGAALVIGSDDDGSVLAESLGTGSATDEFTDRWRTPGDARSKQWEEKFGETRYGPLAEKAFAQALAAAGLSPDRVDTLIVSGLHGRACQSVRRSLAGSAEVTDDLTATVGNPGAAQPALLLTSALESAGPDRVIVLLVLADGADAFVFRTTDALAQHQPLRPVSRQIEAGAAVSYGQFLTWRGMLTPEPPRRPEPARVSSAAAARNEDWKYGFVASADRTTGTVHLPPARVSAGGVIDDMEPVPMSGATGTIAAFTIDRMAWSPSPPVVFAIVDFDGGGRLPIELTDVDADEVAVGGRVEMTFRRLSTADGIHNYFWKARPVRG